MLALPPEPGWRLRAQADEGGVTELVGHDGRPQMYEDLREAAGEKYASELAPAIWNLKYERCMNAIARLGQEIRCLEPDLLVIIGDDQEELFSLKNNPSIAISYASSIQSASTVSAGNGHGNAFHKGLGINGNSYPGDPDGARHIIGNLVDDGFDITAISGLEEEKGFGHAFTWVLGRLLDGIPLATIPVLLNTYYPPNQPTPKRCVDLGRALRAACESLPGDKRVVVAASGGLSHFVVNADLDRAVLEAIRTKDLAYLQSIPAAELNSGTSEIRNWITMSGASEDLTCQWVEYQAVYRTAAGTGCGLAFTMLS